MVKRDILILRRNMKEEYVQQILSVDPCLSVLDHPDPDVLSKHSQIDPDRIKNDYRKAEIVLTYGVPTNFLELASNLKWMQLTSAGFDHLDESIQRSHIKITNAVGIHGVTIAEHTLMFMLMFLRQAQDLVASKESRTWKKIVPKELRGMRNRILTCTKLRIR